ncbi:uncharacterized protein LOC127629976 isoform X3 [Xyrauchen texanus]|uniref:uncharacterized protein LOC127629976 isoform X3 n=1 Tax=Xyrauchen texanus TaxID=154827 RepID=UPI00224296FA|nr:uncharacterized protein LOC127629976 isoform X3 [Xyrauchen texanus]
MSKMLYTRCLQDLHRVNINYVHRLVQSNSKTSSSKHENGFKLYISSYIHDYEVSDKNEAGEVSVRASCFRSMRKKERPHNLSVLLKDSKPVELLAYHCSCVAGLTLYNHVAAFLYQTSHYSQQGATAVPPTHSCTGSEQQWLKPRTQGFKPGPTNEMVVLSARPKERRLAEGRSCTYVLQSGCDCAHLALMV